MIQLINSILWKGILYFAINNNLKMLVLEYYLFSNFFSLKDCKGGEYLEKINCEIFLNVIVLWRSFAFLSEVTSFVYEKTIFLVTSAVSLNIELTEYLIINSQPSKMQLKTAMGFDSSEHHVSEIKIFYLYFEMVNSLWLVSGDK